MKHTLKGFITYEKTPYDNKPKIDFFTFRPSANVFPYMSVVSEHSIEVEVPDNFDPRPEFIKALKEKEQKARADFELLVTDIRRQISQYEAISMDKPA